MPLASGSEPVGGMAPLIPTYQRRPWSATADSACRSEASPCGRGVVRLGPRASLEPMTAFVVLAIVVVALVLFSLESIPIEVSSLTVVCLLALTGVLTPEQAFEGFSNDTVIFIFTLLAMTQGLASTGVVQLVGQRLAFFARFGHQTFVLAMMVVVAAFSSIVSNTVTTAAFLPVAIGAAHRARCPRARCCCRWRTRRCWAG